MDTLRDDLLRCLRRKGFEEVHLDFVFCASQTEAFEKRFGHSDYESYFGLTHRKIEIPVKINYSHGRDNFKVSFWGTLGTQQLLPYGTAEEVYAQTIANLTACGTKGGIVIGPTHMVEPEVKWENLMAIKDAAQAYEESFKLKG